jgi:hypothetical protein
MNWQDKVYSLLIERRSGASRARTAGRKEDAEIEKKKRRAERKGRSTIDAAEAHRMGRRSAESFGASRELTKAAKEHGGKGTAASEVAKKALTSHAKERDIVARRQRGAGRAVSRRNRPSWAQSTRAPYGKERAARAGMQTGRRHGSRGR